MGPSSNNGQRSIASFFGGGGGGPAKAATTAEPPKKREADLKGSFIVRALAFRLSCLENSLKKFFFSVLLPPLCFVCCLFPCF